MPDEPYRQMPIYRRDGSIKATVLVSETDFAHVSRWRWTLDSKGYVKRNTRVAGSRRSHTVKLHREVLGLTDPRIKGDHINGNPLDNRRGDLRPGTHAQNLQNLHGRYRGSRSQYRGVSRFKTRWTAQVRLDGYLHHLGGYEEERVAARAAEAFRRTHMPFAVGSHARSPPAVPLSRLSGLLRSLHSALWTVVVRFSTQMGFLDALHRLYNQLCAVIAGLFVGYWGAVGFHNSWAAPMRYPALGAVSGLAVFLAVLALGARGDRKRTQKRVKAREAEILWEEQIRARSRTSLEPESLPTWARQAPRGSQPEAPRRTGIRWRRQLVLFIAPMVVLAGIAGLAALLSAIGS